MVDLFELQNWLLGYSLQSRKELFKFFNSQKWFKVLLFLLLCYLGRRGEEVSVTKSWKKEEEGLRSLCVTEKVVPSALHICLPTGRA